MGNDEALTKDGKMSRSVWVINGIGWEYDDNNYYKSGGGRPLQAYTDKEIALSFWRELEAGEIRSVGNTFFRDFVSEYMLTELSAIYDSDDLSATLKDLEVNHDGDGDFSFAKSVHSYSDEKLLNIAKIFGVQFYELIEVELVA